MSDAPPDVKQLQWIACAVRDALFKANVLPLPPEDRDDRPEEIQGVEKLIKQRNAALSWLNGIAARPAGGSDDE